MVLCYRHPSEWGGEFISVENRELREFLSFGNCKVLDYIVPPLPVSPMMSFRINNTATLLKCNSSSHDAPHHFKCYGGDDHDNELFYGLLKESNSSFTGYGCSTIQLLVSSEPHSDDPFTFLIAEISMTVTISPDSHTCYQERRSPCRLGPENLCDKGIFT